MSALFAFLHHVAAFVVFAALMIEFILVRNEINLRSAQQLLRTDAMLGMSASLVLVIGILRVIYFEKGSDYYLHSAPFFAKVSVFVLVALLSIYPTVKFMGWRTAIRQGKAPVVDAATLKSLRTVLHLELVGIVVVILMAALMARGIGMLV
jgi:putative membrane protein